MLKARAASVTQIILFAAIFAALQIVAVSHNTAHGDIGHTHDGEEVQHILSGQILFVSWERILAFLPIYGAGLILWFSVVSLRQGVCFYGLFAIIVTASVQLVGIYLVFASLILPALAVNRIRKPSIGLAMGLSAISVIGGNILSTVSDLPAGPVLVFAFAAVAIITRLVTQGISPH